MNTIDKQRILAVSKLEELGYTFTGGEWLQLDNDTTAPFITDALHALIIKRADELAHAIDAYESVRWPKGRMAARG